MPHSYYYQDSASMQEQSRIKRMQSVLIVDYSALLENKVVKLLHCNLTLILRMRYIEMH